MNIHHNVNSNEKWKYFKQDNTTGRKGTGRKTKNTEIVSTISTNIFIQYY